MTETKDEKPIIFYCKDCEEIVDVNRFGKKYVYKCKKCGTKNVAFGTRRSIIGFFRLDEKELNKGKNIKEKEEKNSLEDTKEKTLEKSEKNSSEDTKEKTLEKEEKNSSEDTKEKTLEKSE